MKLSKKILNTALFLGTFSHIGCVQGTSVHQSRPPERIVLVVCVDGSDSYLYLDRGKRIAIDQASRLPGGSKAFLRWITNDSNSDRATLATIRIPELADKPSNRLAAQAQRDYEKTLQSRERVLDRFSKAILAASTPHAQHTDIWGSIYAASERFVSNADMKPVLVLITDMRDNVGNLHYNIQLHGARVLITGFQSDPTSREDWKSYWTNELRRRGAGDIKFVHVDDLSSRFDTGD